MQDYTSGAFDAFDKEDVAGLLEDRLQKGRETLDDALEKIRALCEPVEAPRDQAAYLLQELFEKTGPSDFQQKSARKNSAEGQYDITATWTISPNGNAEQRDLYITLRSRDDVWSIATIRTAGR